MDTKRKRRRRLVLGNVRCFAGLHEIPLAPLTILVGENSAGKSTMLAMLASLLGSGFPVRPEFRKHPFDLGGFSTIVSRRLAELDRSPEFVIGIREGEKTDADYEEVVASYVGERDQPVLASISIKNSLGTLRAKRGEAGIFTGTLTLVGAVPESSAFDRRSWSVDTDLSSFVFGGAARAVTLREDGGRLLLRFATHLTFLECPGHAVAPIRTKPRRVYDGLLDEFTPEGDHVPPRLARVISDAKSDRERTWQAVLHSFGQQSGLFDRVTTRAMGRKPGSPFQLLAKMRGASMNITDVGYGVNQVLPVVFECVSNASNGVLMLQQPEVHLHPRAQAALGTLFAAAAANQPSATLVVETHSDFLVNRVRQEIAKKTIAADMVSLLYFEKRVAKTKVYEIGLDELGNVVSAPRSYRSFFIQEDLDLLTRA